MDKNSTVKLRTGKTMPVIGAGSWKLTINTAEAIESALRAGFRLIDTSRDYGTQPGVGEGIKKSGLPREQIFLTIKVEETDDAYEITKQNLRELDQEYADLILIHRPPPKGVGEELWQGLMKARDEGMTKHIGVSNYSTAQIRQLADASGEMPVVNQIEWTPFGMSQAMLDFCHDNQIIIQAYSPLTHGKRLNDATLVEIAKRYNKTPAQILLRWNLQIGTVPLPKAGHESHQKENLNIFDFEISPADMEELSGLNEYYSSIGRLPYA